MSIHAVTSRVGSTDITIETGKLAKLADGAVTVTCGETIMLVTAVSQTKVREGQDWFPLSVEYKEKAAAAGQCDIAIANSYYYTAMLSGNDAKQKASAEKLAIFWPNQGEDGRGTHINVSGGAVTKAAKNKANAIKLLEYMTQDEAQRWYSDVNGEYPVKAGVEASELLQSWGEFKADTLNLSELGTHNAQALRIMDKAGWK